MGGWVSRRAGLLAAVVLLSGAWLAPAAQAADTVAVFAAASLKTALDAADAAWTAKTGTAVSVSYAASSALAKQIEAGAPADVFISADLAWMDYVAGKQAIVADSRINLLGNAIVLVAPKDSARPIDIKPGFDLAGALGEGHLAMGAVDSVPAGKYGKAALEKLGVWDKVADRVAGAENVRAALALVSRGEAPLGIVYATDAAADPGVAVVGTFPEDSHPPIIYPMALTVSGGASPAAKAYAAYLASPDAAGFFTAQGFTLLGK